MPSAAHFNAVNCVKGEIHNVVSVLRVSRQWSPEDRFQEEVPLRSESPLLRALKNLHQALEVCSDLNGFDTLKYVNPFLYVIESPHTNGVITSQAISSINKFLLYEFVTKQSPRAKEAINRISEAISKCCFEETHREGDEMVLMKLLELLEYCLRCKVGCLITDRNVWQMIQTCYRMVNDPRSSIYLCHTAENTFAHLVLTLFNRISELKMSTEPFNLFVVSTNAQKLDKDSHPKMNIAAEDATADANEEALDEEFMSENQFNEPLIPYGIAVLHQLLQFLSTLIDATKNDESRRTLALSLINIVLETAGSRLGTFPPLVSVIQGDLSKFLLQNSESTDLSILSLTLRVVFNVFNSLKDHLKVQLEVFFTSVHMRIIDSPSCTYGQKELAMESLVEFCREPALMLDLYVNYDCDVHCTNLFEVLCRSLSKHALTLSNGTLNVLNLLAVEGLLVVVQAIARRCEIKPRNTMPLNGIPASSSRVNVSPIASTSSSVAVMAGFGTTMMIESESDSEFCPDDALAWSERQEKAKILQQRKQSKNKLLLAAERFNTDAKMWISYAQQLNLLPETVTPEAVARFLLSTPGLNKTRVGDYLGEGPPEKYPFHNSVRDAYVELFDFQGLSLDEALRIFLEKFRLPGESQKIDRMMETFSGSYYRAQLSSSGSGESAAGPLKHEDAAFVLSFSIIMLNTDLHSSQIDVSRKMTVEEFIRNNRGINAGENLPPEYLTEIYTKIKTNQIKMQQDASDLQAASGGDVGIAPTFMQWDGILKRSQNVQGAMFTSNAKIKHMKAGIHEREMFKIIAEKLLEAIVLAFEHTSDEEVTFRIKEGLKNCAKIAIYFDLLDILNQMVTKLCRYFSTFAHALVQHELFRDQVPTLTSIKNPTILNHLPNSANSTKHRRPSFQPRLLSREEHWTCRATTALVLIFELVHEYGNYFRQAWVEVIECILVLNELDVLPASLVEMDDFVDVHGVPLTSAATSTEQLPRRSSSSDALSSSEPPQSNLSTSSPHKGQQTHHTDKLASTTNTTTNHGSSSSTLGLSRRVRERTRRRAQQRRDQSKTPSSSGSIWMSLSSLLWSDEDSRENDRSLVIRNWFRPSIEQCGLESESWLKLCKHLSPEALQELIDALVIARDPLRSTTPMMMMISDVAETPNPSVQNYVSHGSSSTQVVTMQQENAILALELMTNLMLANHHRLEAFWPTLYTYFERILQHPTTSATTTTDNHHPLQWLIERMIVQILRVSVRLFDRQTLRPMLIQSIALFTKLDRSSISLHAERMSHGFVTLLKANAMYIRREDSSEVWHVVFGIIHRLVKDEYARSHVNARELMTFLVLSRHITSVNFAAWFNIQQLFLAANPAVLERDTSPDVQQALRLLYELAIAMVNNNNPVISHSSSSSHDSAEEEGELEMINACWLTMVRQMHAFVTHSHFDISKTAWDCLHSTFISPGPLVSKDTWAVCFDEMLFRLSDQISKGGLAQVESPEDLKIRCLALLNKAFLHHVSKLTQLPHFAHLWMKLLKGLASELAETEERGEVYCHALQFLTNILMIMKKEGVLVDPQQSTNDGASNHLSELTWTILDTLCPQVRKQMDAPFEDRPSLMTEETEVTTAQTKTGLDSPEHDKRQDTTVELEFQV